MKSIDPVDHRLMVDREQPPDSAKAVAFEVEFESQLFGLVVVAERKRLWRVLAAALLTLKTLAALVSKTSFDLARSVLAMRTSNGNYLLDAG
jgi:hypothetical protein